MPATRTEAPGRERRDASLVGVVFIATFALSCLLLGRGGAPGDGPKAAPERRVVLAAAPVATALHAVPAGPTTGEAPADTPVTAESIADLAREGDAAVQAEASAVLAVLADEQLAE
jgi:hypothetical protein